MSRCLAALIAVISLSSAAPALASAPRCRDLFSSVAAAQASAPTLHIAGDENLSQAIRSNAVHYWSYVDKLPAATPLKSFEKYQGIVVGDPHLGNFSVVPVVLPSGRREMQFVDIDFDDAGRGSYAFDFARFALTVKAADRDVKIRSLLDAYLTGLAGTQIEAPRKVAKALSLRVDAYDQLDAAYVDRKSTGGKFHLKEGVLAKFTGKPYSRAQIAAAFPGEEILDVAERPKERGGSANSIRIWVLLKGRNGGPSTIIEIKGYQQTAVTHYAEQKSPEAWFEEIHSKLWKGLSPQSYRLAQLGKDWAWIRSKKVALFDVPYGIKSEKQKIFLEELSVFDANYLGLLHGAQAGAGVYAQAIAKDPNVFREAVKAFVRDYLELTKKTMK